MIPCHCLCMLFRTLPLILSLHNPAKWTQVCYINDASACRCLDDIHEWFYQLCSKGPAFGYHPEPSKSFCFLMTDISLKLKDCLVLCVFGLLQIIISYMAI